MIRGMILQVESCPLRIKKQCSNRRIRSVLLCEMAGRPCFILQQRFIIAMKNGMLTILFTTLQHTIKPYKTTIQIDRKPASFEWRCTSQGIIPAHPTGRFWREQTPLLLLGKPGLYPPRPEKIYDFVNFGMIRKPNMNGKIKLKNIRLRQFWDDRNPR